MNVKISVIIPVYNMQDDIANSLTHLISQKGEYEFIVVDDGSKDNSYEECCKIAREDKRVNVYHIENQGAGIARNYGISKAQGKYLYFPDADDIIGKNALEKMYDEIENSKADLLVFGYKSIRRNGDVIYEKKYLNKEFEAEYVRNNYSDFFSMISQYSIQGAPWNKLFNHAIIKDNGIEFPNMRRHQDEAFIGRYMSSCKYVKFISESLYIYKLNELRNEWEKYPDNYIDIVKQLYCERENNILSWNRYDKLTHKMVKREFYCNVIRACEFSFAKKRHMNLISRYGWIKKQIIDCDLKAYDSPELLGSYTKLILVLIRKKFYFLVYLVLWLKVFLTKSGIFYKIKMHANK